jgi:hypothetical protein
MLRLTALAALVALAACAAQETQTADAAQGPRDCFRVSNIANARAIDDQNIRVHTTFDGDYIIRVRSNARDVNQIDPIIIQTNNGLVCTGNGLDLTMAAGDPPMTLLIQQITRAPEEPTPPTGS